ncbi:MAG: UvrB/UvrC motif-containing protein, partial [Bacteroidota bacterium]
RIQRRTEAETAKIRKAAEPLAEYMTFEQRQELIDQMFDEMKKAARELDFERAAELRDEIQRLEAIQKEAEVQK